MPRIDGCAYVFTTDGENASSGFSKSKAKLDEDIELKDYTLHDLRRTMVVYPLVAFGCERHPFGHRRNL